MPKPIFFCDLDDTLFQTRRKMKGTQTPGQAPVAAFDRSGQPRSFFNPQQQILVQWLLEQSHLIPVTARGTAEIARVNIAFNSWQVTTHGAVILSPDGSIDPVWQQKMITALTDYQQRIVDLQQFFTQAFEHAGIAAWARINYEYDQTAVYLVAKHTDSHQVSQLYQLVEQLQDQVDLSGFYVHHNDNNIAWIPECITKGNATSYVIDQMVTQHGELPIIGLGDSISDMSFLGECHWLGMPSQSQLSSQFSNRTPSERFTPAS